MKHRCVCEGVGVRWGGAQGDNTNSNTNENRKKNVFVHEPASG